MNELRGPVVVIAMSREAFAQQFDGTHLDRVRRCADLSQPELVEDLHNPVHHERLAKAELLLTSWGTPSLTDDILDRMPRLKAVFHCAGTVKHLVGDSFWARGIQLTNAADANAIPVAEFTFASIVLAGKKAQFYSREAVASRPPLGVNHPRHPFGTVSNYQQSIGIIGFSRIGRRVVEQVSRLHRSTCWVADPYASREAVELAGGQLCPLQEMLPKVSILSIHAPALEETRHMIGAKELAMLPDHATLINTARGSLVDTAALEAECASGRLNAVLDVTDPEPLPSSSVMWGLQNVSITPHIAGSLGTETFRMTDQALQEMERFVSGLALASPITVSDLEYQA
ncbi:hydroxyacid dehydrogenase [Arthrobacter sp. YN]|uniref:hydroxyacid dehydrogenase n=1 Tax=Arthrobacter sp. YN TaxID=2020486 RepID=UPI000B611F29|nr:hydroxyacid dehydrogenase [Arthrobacter sp. YN]ASN22645.1 hydroxyacid dehydrogenase [Arthrobacter sp. YN]